MTWESTGPQHTGKRIRGDPELPEYERSLKNASSEEDGKPLSRDEEMILADAIETGELARNEVAEEAKPAVMALVESLALGPDDRVAFNSALDDCLCTAIERSSALPEPQCHLPGEVFRGISNLIIRMRPEESEGARTDGLQPTPCDKESLKEEAFCGQFPSRQIGEHVLWERIAAREKAIRRLTKSALGWLVYTVKTHPDWLVGDQRILDACQEAVFPLRRAAAAFRRSAGCRFGTLAKRCIRLHLVSWSRMGTGGKQNVARQWAEYRRAERELAQRQGPSPTMEEVFDALGWSERKRAGFRGVVIARRQGRVSIESLPVLPPDPGAKDPSCRAIRTEEFRLLNEALGALPEREQTALRLKFGSDSACRDVAREMGISTSQAESLCHRALENLKSKIGRCEAFAET